MNLLYMPQQHKILGGSLEHAVTLPIGHIDGRRRHREGLRHRQTAACASNGNARGVAIDTR
jgi:hypothetical protein